MNDDIALCSQRRGLNHASQHIQKQELNFDHNTRTFTFRELLTSLFSRIRTICKNDVN